ncbi:MAG TPA: hypothetical protein VHV74_18460 [Pseudonocardiaceae bacterium]|nr:hypothetical protein [Pseudonocardiaceae bacterium]
MLRLSVHVRSPSSNALVLLALVLGLVLGGTTVGMIWFVSGRSASAVELQPSTARLDAAAACATLARVSATRTADGGDLLVGAASLASAAQAADVRYSTLAAALHRATGTHGTTALADARAACAGM